MEFWLEVLKAAATSIGAVDSSEVKIQIRRPNDGLWRDFSSVSSNNESVLNGVQLAASAYLDADVRAIDKEGRILDFK